MCTSWTISKDQHVQKGITDHAAGGLNSLGLTVELIAETFDIVETVGYDDVVAREHAFHGRVLFRPGVLLGLSGMVYPTGQAKRLIIDEVDLELAGAGIGALAGDLGLEEILQLAGTCGLASRGIPRDNEELGSRQRTTTRSGR